VSGISRKTILIVEDNPLNLRLFRDVLQTNGYQTLQSTDGRDVLALAEQNKPDLILMDIRLPGISGLDITKALKEQEELRHIPVLAVTASALKGDEARLLEGGCDGFIAKPIDLSKFLAKIEELLGQKANAPDLAGASPQRY
jgi:two-component system, cell cycle response regulator DivK